jgi:hypothetical protein
MKEMAEGDIVFVTDFKENVHLPLVTDQASRSFYHNQQTAVLAIVGIYCEGGIQKTVVFFFTSKIIFISYIEALLFKNRALKIRQVRPFPKRFTCKICFQPF